MKTPILDVDQYWDSIKSRVPDIITSAVKQQRDIPPVIVPAKDGKVLAYVCPNGGSEHYLAAMRIIIMGMEPDEIIFVTDAYTSVSRTKHDGTPWQHGEMEQAYLDRTINHDLVHENLSLLRMDRVGGVYNYSQDYIRNEDDTVTFGDVRDLGQFIETSDKSDMFGTTEGVGGRMVDELRKYFDRETFRQYITRLNPNDPILQQSDEVFTLGSVMMVAKKALIPMGCSVMVTVGVSEGVSNEFVEQDVVTGEMKAVSLDQIKVWMGVLEDDETS